MELTASYSYRFCSLLGRYHKAEPGPPGAGEDQNLQRPLSISLDVCVFLPLLNETELHVFTAECFLLGGEAEEEACFFLKLSISVSLSDFW